MCLSGAVRDAETCAGLSEALAEPLPGTAAVARGWLCLEQPGPWGRNAVAESRLDPELGQELTARAEAHGLRVQLIRHPARKTPQPRRRVLLANTHPRHCWLRAADVEDPAELLDLDFAGIAAGEHGGFGHPATEPVLLVCTNGRRDQCCALRGRALAGALSDQYGEQVWETSHTGGHRFAPAAVLLPTGYTYGRLGVPEAQAVLSAALAGKVALEHCRGRSTWSQPAQAAELALREQLSEHLVDAVVVEDDEDGAVRVGHQDGRRWLVEVRQDELDPPRPNSCGKEPARPVARTVTGISLLRTDRRENPPQLG